MSQVVMISFRKEVSLVEISDGKAALKFPAGKWTLDQITPGLRAAFRTLSSGGATEDDLSNIVLGLDNPSGLAQLHYYLEQCSKLRLLCYTVVTEGQPLAIVVPMTDGFQFDSHAVAADTRFRLSRFAYC